MPNGFCESGIVGTSKTRSRSRARFGRAHTWRKQPKKVSLTSSKRYSRVLARFLGTWNTCYAAGAMVGTRLGGLWVVLMDLLTSQETASRPPPALRDLTLSLCCRAERHACDSAALGGPFGDRTRNERRAQQSARPPVCSAQLGASIAKIRSGASNSGFPEH